MKYIGETITCAGKVTASTVNIACEQLKGSLGIAARKVKLIVNDFDVDKLVITIEGNEKDPVVICTQTDEATVKQKVTCNKPIKVARLRPAFKFMERASQAPKRQSPHSADTSSTSESAASPAALPIRVLRENSSQTDLTLKDLELLDALCALARRDGSAVRPASANAPAGYDPFRSPLWLQ
jgi:hypothetical protein